MSAMLYNQKIVHFKRNFVSFREFRGGKTKKNNIICIILFILVFTITPHILASNIQVDNVNITEQSKTSDYNCIRLDISWDNSRHTTSSTPNNWDAAWIFAKFRNGSNDWKHCTLAQDGHIAPKGATIEVGMTDGVGKGVFIYKSDEGTGIAKWDNVKLVWNSGKDGVSDDDIIEVKVFAIEMVYIPQSPFSLYNGECDNIYSNFNSGNTICSEDPLPQGAITWSVETNWCGAQTEDGKTGGCDSLCADYPKGYQGFYCMKYEISQGQYADFLSTLTENQANNRYPNQFGNFQYTIHNDNFGHYYAQEPDRACNFLSWADCLAYADWAGLRPMTELEYEKICRGPQNITINRIQKDKTENVFFSSDNENSYRSIGCQNENNEYYERVNYCMNSGSITKPETFNSSYYGVMAMNDNLSERCITVAKYCWNDSTWNNETGAGDFDGKHGDGYLSNNGCANVLNWQSQNCTCGYSACGCSYRGVCWHFSTSNNHVSDRHMAAYPYAGRIANSGFRAVRTR